MTINQQDITTFIVSSTIITGFLGLIWKTSDGLNTFIKVVLLLHCFYGLVIIFKS